MNRRSGFTLIELVVVIMILGILAGVAAPKFFSTSATATDNGIKQSLGIVRDAIELFSANNGGSMPRSDTSANFETDLSTYIRGGKIPTFPIGTVGTTNNSTVKFGATPDNLSGWMFDNTAGPNKGAFFPNCTTPSSLGPNYNTF